MENFNEIQLGILLITASYGFVFGIRNTLIRIGSMFGFGKYNQSTLGSLLDVLFYAGVGYSAITYFGI